jgi:hypothetical protein
MHRKHSNEQATNEPHRPSAAANPCRAVLPRKMDHLRQIGGDRDRDSEDADYLKHGFSSSTSDFNLDGVTLNSDGIAINGILRRPPYNSSGTQIELRAVAGTGDDRFFQLALRKGTLSVSASVAERVQLFTDFGDCDL